MARPQQWKSEELDTQRIPIWTSFHSPRRDVPSIGKQSQIQYHHQRSEKSGSLASQCTGQPKSICNEYNYEHLLFNNIAYQFTDPIKNLIHQLLSNSVVTTGIIVGSIFFTGDQLFRMKQGSVCTSSHLICLLNHMQGDKNMWF